MRSGIDEMPQLINVLAGTMSLVGPRPIVPAEFEHYPQYGTNVRDLSPGITGYWQVSGMPSVEYARRAELERYYADHFPLRLDLLILLKTILKLGLIFAPSASGAAIGGEQPQQQMAAKISLDC